MHIEKISINIIDFIIGFILYLIISSCIEIEFKSFMIGLIFPVVTVIITTVIKGLIK